MQEAPWETVTFAANSGGTLLLASPRLKKVRLASSRPRQVNVVVVDVVVGVVDVVVVDVVVVDVVVVDVVVVDVVAVDAVVVDVVVPCGKRLSLRRSRRLKRLSRRGGSCTAAVTCRAPVSSWQWSPAAPFWTIRESHRLRVAHDMMPNK